MTQLVKKDSSWRTLRRKAVVGASSLALVAGMGVALAPVASAAASDVTVKVANSSATQILTKGAEATWTYTVTTKDATNDVQTNFGGANAFVYIRVKGAGLDNSVLAGAITTNDLSGSTALATGNCQTQAEVDAGWFCAAGALKAGGTDIGDLIAPNATTAATDDFDLGLTLNPSTTFGAPAPSGALTLEVSFLKGTVSGSQLATVTGGPYATLTSTANFVSASAPSFNALATPSLGSAYNASLLNEGLSAAGTSAGYPKLVGAVDPSDTSLTGAAATPVANKTVVRNTGVAVGSRTYVSLNDEDTTVWTAATATVAGSSLTGFFFETTSGNVSYGTLASVWDSGSAKNVFSQQVIRKPYSGKYTWIAISNNGEGGAVANAQSGLAKLTLAAGDVASAPFKFVVNAAFTDVAATNVFRDAINALTGMGVINGTTPTTFNPAGKVTRGEFAAMAGRLLSKIDASLDGGSGACDANAVQVFTDVANSNVFCKEITYLAAFGVVKGTSATTFEPNAPVTRDQIATFVYRLSLVLDGSPVADKAPADSAAFSDVKATQPLSGNVTWANSTDPKIVEGFEGGLFKPADNAQRDQAAAFLYRFYQVES